MKPDAEAILFSHPAERLVDAIDLPIGRWALSGDEARLLFCNRPYTRWAGRSSADLVGCTLGEIHGAEAWEAARSAFAAAFSGQAAQYERRTPNADSNARWVRVQVFPDRNAGGEVEAVYTLCCDIHDDVQQREQAQQARQRLTRFTEHIPYPLTYVDRHYCLQFVNLAYQNAVAMPAGALVGRRLGDVRGHKRWAEHKPYFDRALAGESVQYTRLVQYQPDTGQGKRWMRTSYVPDFDDDRQVQGVYTVTIDVHELTEAQQRLARSAERDGLTDALSRRTMMERLDEAAASCGTQPVGLFFIDLDHFKALNDARGHAAGDALLIALSQALQQAVRAEDAVGRFGGDEFLVLAGVRDAVGAAALAEHLLAAVRACTARCDGAQGVSASIGYALAPHDATQPLRLLQLADEAMYAAKRGGKNRVQRYRG